MGSSDLNKERLQGIEFARACSIIGIIIYHYFCYSLGTFKFLFLTANGAWGDLFVTVFFVISGAVLYYNYPRITSLKTFYFKRWKAIFPPFYLCFLPFFFLDVIRFHHFFYAGNPLRFLFSLFGIDGYFSYKCENYYQVGEWFLGAIIMLYIIYPFVLSALNKNTFIIPFLLIFGYICMYCTDFFVIYKFRNLITCMASFYFGMVAVKNKEFFFKNIICGIVSLLIFIFLYFIKMPNLVFLHQLHGFTLFIVLIQFGNWIMKTRLGHVFTQLSKLSFFIYLLHHKILRIVQIFYNPDQWYMILAMLAFIILLAILAAKVLSTIVDYITQSKPFKRLEAKFVEV